MLKELTGISTIVIALATVAYVVVTAFLWRVTKKSADAAKTAAEAAKLSAEAAKRSADVGVALHRPYLGVSEFQRHNDYNQDMWAVRCCVKNYGKLPASKVRVDFAVGQSAGDATYAGGLLCDDTEVLAQAEVGGFFRMRVDAHGRSLLSSGVPMVAQVLVGYLGPDGTKYTHTARLPYTMTTQNFTIGGSGTTGESH